MILSYGPGLTIEFVPCIRNVAERNTGDNSHSAFTKNNLESSKCKHGGNLNREKNVEKMNWIFVFIWIIFWDKRHKQSQEGLF